MVIIGDFQQDWWLFWLWHHPESAFRAICYPNNSSKSFFLNLLISLCVMFLAEYCCDSFPGAQLRALSVHNQSGFHTARQV
jgi:hypothetical protein